MNRMILAASVALVASLSVAAAAVENQLHLPGQNDTDYDVIWAAGGKRVEILTPRITAADSASELSVSRGECHVADGSTQFRYDIQGHDTLSMLRGSLTITFRPEALALRMEESLKFDKLSTADIRVTTRYRVSDNQAMALVTEDTEFRPLDFYSGTAAIYTRGALAHPLSADRDATAVFRFVYHSTDKDGAGLSMPVVALAFRGQGSRPSFLSLATDPFCGMQTTASIVGDDSLLERETIYRGSVLPFSRERRVAAMEWTDRGADGIFQTFYRTIPEIHPCAAWARDVAMGYYDYNSDDGRGWYNDLAKLAELIPIGHRGKVACCLHGWYDRTGFYCYDQTADALADNWTVFDNGMAGRKPINMSKSEIHRKIGYAKSLGFRVVLYFADATNMTASKVQDSWCGKDYRKYLYTNMAGKQPAGWTGPCGGGLQLDISLPEVRKWFIDYFKALLREYGGEVDGYVLDESNYFSAGAVCQRNGRPKAYGDQAQMQFLHDLTVLLQEQRHRNPDLCFFEGSHYLYGLVTHGSFTDFEGIPLAVNYRNTSIQCCWEDPGIRNVHCKFRTDPDRQYPYGLDVGLTNGWGSDMGPSEMPSERLAEVIAHFRNRVAQGPPNPKVPAIYGMEALLQSR